MSYRYYELIHPLLPILPHTPSGIQRIVQIVPAGLCEAFFAALDAAVNASTQPYPGNVIKSAAAQISNIESDPDYTKTTMSKAVLLQALILMIIAKDNAGPRIQHQYINAATQIAMDIGLGAQPSSGDPSEKEPYTRGDLGRRSWLTLFILDRWHAVGHGGVYQIPEARCKLRDSDYSLLGHTTYHLFRKHFRALFHPPKTANQLLQASPAAWAILCKAMPEQYRLTRCE